MTKPISYKFYLENDNHIRRIHDNLATEIGLNESIVLLQIDFLVNINGNDKVYDGKYWTYDSVKNMREKFFPFWSDSTLRRILNNLVNQGLLLVSNHNKKCFDKTSWYTINYEKANELGSIIVGCEYKGRDGECILSNCINGFCQNDKMDSVKMREPIPDTSSEISSENSTSTVGGKVASSGLGENKEEEKREDKSFSKENFWAEQKEKILSDIKKVGAFSPQKEKQYKRKYYAGDKKKFKRHFSRKGLNFSGGWTEAAKEVLEELDPNSEPYRYVMYESQLWDRSKSKNPETIEPNLLLEYTMMYPALLHFRLLEENGDSELAEEEEPASFEEGLEMWRNS